MTPIQPDEPEATGPVTPPDGEPDRPEPRSRTEPAQPGDQAEPAGGDDGWLPI